MSMTKVVASDTSTQEVKLSPSDEVLFHSAIVNSSPNSIVGLNPAGIILSWNLAAERLFGYTSQEAIGRNIRFFVPPELWPQEEMAQAKANQGERVVELESARIHKDGRRVEISITIAPVRNGEGAIVGLVRISRDITERKRIEERLRLLVEALEATASGVVIANLQGNIMWVNSAFEKLTGYTYAEAVLANVRLLKSGKHGPAFYKTMWDTVMAGEVWKGELTNRRKDGTLYPEEMDITPIQDASGKITHFIAIKHDITERVTAAAEREKLITALQNALSEVKTLSGLLPICSSCKKIRDDKGYWSRLEEYLSKHSNTQITHGICPDCAQKMLDELSLIDPHP
jgi:PAS domain S-box-containing protein